MWSVMIAQGGFERGLSEVLYPYKSSPSLLARNTLRNNVQTAVLPSNQWQIEREHLYKASLAVVQSGPVDF